MDKTKKQIIPSTSAALTRTKYSLISCSDLTPEDVDAWRGLPEELKYDSSLDVFKKFHEKEDGSVDDSLKIQVKDASPETEELLIHSYNNGQFSESEEKEAEVDRVIKKSKVDKFAPSKYYIKMTTLIGAWVFFTVIFLLYNEKEDISRRSSLLPGEIKSYQLEEYGEILSLGLIFKGPFLNKLEEMELNSTQRDNKERMNVWVESWTDPGVNNLEVANKTMVVDDKRKRRLQRRREKNSILKLKPVYSMKINETRKFYLKINSTSETPISFSMVCTLNALDRSTGVMYACILLFALYVLIIFEIINRALAAILLATLSLAVLSMVGERPSLEELISWLDVETLLLLFSMMILVSIMTETGIFDYLAVFTFQVAKGRLWPLISLLWVFTVILSFLLDNVTTVLLMTPITIKLCEVTNLDPIPVLMAVVLYSNIGGTTTPIADPPNIIVASNKDVVRSGIHFANFTLHMSFGTLFVCLQAYFQLRYIMYRNPNKLRLNISKEVDDLRKQISVWQKASDSIPHLSRDHSIVRRRLERKIMKLTTQLKNLEKRGGLTSIPKETYKKTLRELKEKYKIRDKFLLIKSAFAIGFVVLIFFMHAIPEFHRVSLGWTALLGAVLLLILADREDLEPIMHRVEWTTLIFFAALFVFMEALSKLGLIMYIGDWTESLITRVDESARLIVAMLVILWVSALTSAFVDNVPLTTMMIGVVTSLGSNPSLNLPMSALIWALLFGVCLGGNGTLVGASANLVCAGVAEQHGYKITFVGFFKVGFPMMLGHLLVATVYLFVCHCVFVWH